MSWYTMKVGRITETGKKFVQGVQRMGEAINRAKPFIVKSSVKPPEIKPVKTLKDELIDLHKEATAELQKYFAVYEKAKGVPLKFSLKPVEAWFNELGVQTGGLQKGREYKILQLGGLIPQPTGGWEIPTPTKEFMIAQLLNVLQGDPKFVICTEAPSDTFFDGVGVVYRRVGTSSVGVLSNTEFEIVPDSSFPSQDGFRCVCFTLTVGDTSLKILNLHGDSGSSSGKAEKLRNVLEACKSEGIEVVTGDMNITVSKTIPSKTLKTTANDLGVDPSCLTLSTEVIEKERIKGDILENNQLTKGGEKISEVDSMMILDINKYSHPDSSEPVPESPVLYGPLRAFTPYSKANPIIADHTVITRSVKGIILVSVNTASVDDKDKGFLIKGEWADIDRPLFATLVSQPYTQWWVPRCRQVLDTLTPEQKGHPEMQKVFTWIDKFLGVKSGGRPRPGLRQGLRRTKRLRPRPRPGLRPWVGTRRVKVRSTRKSRQARTHF